MSNWNPDHCFHKVYSSAKPGITQITNDVLQIFEQVYNIDTAEKIIITDDIEYPHIIKAKEESEKKWRRSNRNTWMALLLLLLIIGGAVYYYIYLKPGSPNNKRAVSLSQLEMLQNKEEAFYKALSPRSNSLSAAALIELANCSTISCIELYMKDSGQDFIYGRKGEYAAKLSVTINDTAGKEWTMPASTFYIEVNPQASWKVAHTLHSKVIADSLLNVFIKMGFQLADKRFYADVAGEGYRYTSVQYPGIGMYVSTSFKPWYFKGLYHNKITWPCYMFQVYKEQ